MSKDNSTFSITDYKHVSVKFYLYALLLLFGNCLLLAGCDCGGCCSFVDCGCFSNCFGDRGANGMDVQKDEKVQEDSGLFWRILSYLNLWKSSDENKKAAEEENNVEEEKKKVEDKKEEKKEGEEEEEDKSKKVLKIQAIYRGFIIRKEKIIPPIIVDNDQNLNKDGIIGHEDVISINNEDWEQPKLSDPEGVISLGINIGAQTTICAKCSNDPKNPINIFTLSDTGARVVTSIICYTKTHRLFGENSIASLKQNIDTSYHNLSRLIGFKNDIEIYAKEKNYCMNHSINKDDLFLFKVDEKNKLIGVKSDIIIASFIYLLNRDIFFKQKSNGTYSSTYISVPDFFTGYQKQNIELILKALNMRDVHVVNESSAITMYYGYTKYRDNFGYNAPSENNVVVKNILFIDAGHSKTSFILSSFKYDEFKVLKVICIPNVGGRNFDEKIMNYCIEEFLKKENIKKEDFDLTDKMKYRLLAEIEKSRKNLTVNTESRILVDSFYSDIDLDIILTREKFEHLEKNVEEEEQEDKKEEKKDDAKTFTDLIKDELEIFKKGLEDMLQYAQDENIKIDCVERAGNLMRTPILQKNVIENQKLKGIINEVGQSVALDECTSVGAALLGNHIKGKSPSIIENCKNFYHYNYYRIMYQISDNRNESNDGKNILIDIGTIASNQNVKQIVIENKFIVQGKPIYFKIFYDKENNNNVEFFTEQLYLKILKIDLYQSLIENNYNIDNIKNDSLVLKITFDLAQYATTEELLFDDKPLNAKIEYISNTNKDINKDIIYIPDTEREEYITNMRKELGEYNNCDKRYDRYVDIKAGYDFVFRNMNGFKAILNDEECEKIKYFQENIGAGKDKGKGKGKKEIPPEGQLIEYENNLKDIVTNIIETLLKNEKDICVEAVGGKDKEGLVKKLKEYQSNINNNNPDCSTFGGYISEIGKYNIQFQNNIVKINK